MSKRLITENWYKFLKETDDSGLDIMKATEEIAQLEAMVENLEETIRSYRARIKHLEDQMSYDEYSASQIKEDKDG